MKSKYKFLIRIATVFAFLAIAVSSHGDTIPQKPSNYVVDLAGIIDGPTESTLNSLLMELEQKTTAQLVVLTIKSLEGKSIEEFSINIAHDQWKLGQKGKDNGVLLLIAVNDRKYRIEVGYGLEGILPDSRVGSIGRNYLVPFFRKGEFSRGAYAAAFVLAGDIAAEAGVTLSKNPNGHIPVRTVRKNEPMGLTGKLLFFAVLLILLVFFIRNPKLFLVFLLFSAMGGRGGSWSSGRGGFGGGGFGGGGGGFGGGGASGGW